MKKFFISLGVLALGFMASCQQEEVINEASQLKAGLGFTATLEEGAVGRTQLSPLENGGYKVWWSENDNICVFASENTHAQYAVADGVGTVRGTFSPVGGDKIEGNEIWNDGTEMFVAVYPHLEGTKVAKDEKGFTINTVIPTKQTFVAGSFGQGAYPMVAVSEDNDFAFKNVGAIIVLPLKGEAKIVEATLASKKHNIAGQATITVEGNNWIPTVDVTNDENAVVVDCGEGVQLKADEATNFYFVFAPGTYEAEDLSIKFTDALYNYYEFVIPVELTYERSQSTIFNEKTYVAQNVEKDELWIKAIAPAYANAERMIPAIDNLNYIGWIKELASHDKDEICSLLKRAATQASLGNYKETYDILGGIPGFKKETKRFEFVGEDTQKLQYTYTEYLQSLMAEINEIDSADEFVAYVNKLAIRYEGAEEEVDNILGSIGTFLGKYESIIGKLDVFGVLDAIMDVNITKLLLEYSTDKDGIIYKAVSKLFEYDAIIDKVQEGLTTIVKKYEDLEKSAIDKENVDKKLAAINLTKGIAIGEAQFKAAMGIEDAIYAANKANLDNLNKGPWGILKKIITWEPCVKYFEECNMSQVLETLLTLCENVETMISYERVETTKYEVAVEEYVLGEHWWILKEEPAI